MRVRVLSIDGCDATPTAIELVRDTAMEMAIDIDLEHVIVTTPEEATEYRHIGSPTIHVEGRDIEPEARNVRRFGLT